MGDLGTSALGSSERVEHVLDIESSGSQSSESVEYGLDIVSSARSVSSAIDMKVLGFALDLYVDAHRAC